jgi:type IV pilus assembly protein PilY1
MGTQLKATLGTAWRAVAVLAMLLLPAAQAEDIDIFMANTSSSSTVQPNIMVWLDNSANWSRQSQGWPDNGGDQGRAEVVALQAVLAGSVPANMGLAGQAGSGTVIGGYVRFGIRDMRSATNKTALNNILSYLAAGNNINSSTEKVNEPEPAAAMFEMYRYFSSGSVYRGGWVSGNDPATNVDKSANTGSPSASRPTAYGQNLTSGWAIDPTNSARYRGPAASSCGRNYLVMVVNNSSGAVPAGFASYDGTRFGATAITGTAESYIDEWARFLYQQGISVYILDAYNRQQNTTYSRILERAANVGGGKYFPVKNQSQIEAAFKQIFAEIGAVNATFATASLPISATNRSQNLNQVFIGMFRPDGEAEPRWMGNLKRYQLIKSRSGVDLGDALGANAINLQTGFVTECAASFWTTDSASYWSDVYANQLTRSSCTVFPTVDNRTGSAWSDLPDGPVVEKGGVAEILRKGNGTTVSGTPTWVVSRKVLTYSPTATGNLATVTTTLTGWSESLLRWVTGYDDPQTADVGTVTVHPYSEFTNTTASTAARTRPSIHGDVIHSRPLPVNYGDAGVTVFYGANDGMLRAVNAENGQERWAFVAPEHYGRFQRQHDNVPLVNYPNVDSSLNPLPRDYFFDGSMGLHQKADNSRVWIFASQRRGGRMLYGFDVTNPDVPALLWRVGCPHMSDDTGCTSGYTKMGQTWSLPSVAFLKGDSETIPFIVVGGGYDRCEDADDRTPICASDTRKGNVVYVINAQDGSQAASFDTGNGSVVADIAMSDSNGDGSVDFAYAATTSGEIYRIDFSDASFVPQARAAWRIRRVAFTAGASRKFLYAPALLRASNKMYVALGSGDREHPLNSNYPYEDTIVNRFYVLLDDLTVAASSTTAAAVDLDNHADMRNYSVADDATCNVAGVTPNSGLKGWYMNLNRRGEQVVTSALIAAGMVTFNTNRALPAADNNSCVNPLGEARGYWVNLLNASGAIGVGTATCGGDRSSVFVGGGLMPSPTLASVMIGGKMETVAIGAAQRSGGSSSGIAPQQVKPAISSKRKTMYWRSNQAD